MLEIKLGQKVRDKVAGFSGTATAKCEYIDGYISYQLEQVITDGDIVKDWFGVQHLEIIDESVISIPKLQLT